MKIEIHTLRFGDAWWVKDLGGTLDKWCETHGHPLTVWTDRHVSPRFPCEKFVVVDILHGFLKGESEWCMFVDADIYIAPTTPALPPLDTPGFHVAKDRVTNCSRSWPGWCREHFADADEVTEGWIYRNTGVWYCDRQAAEDILDAIDDHFIESTQEQDQLNWWLALANKRFGTPIPQLPWQWNQLVYGKMHPQPAFFHHYAGGRKGRKHEWLKDLGLIEAWPDRSGFRPWETFDFSAYTFTWDFESIAMDMRHIHLLHEVGKLCPGGIAMEIGSYRGASTAALVEALNAGHLRHLHIVETAPRESLHRVLAMANDPGKITLHTKPSWDLEIPSEQRPDIVFIDGDHRWAALGDGLRALTWGAKVIALHDTKAWPGLKDCWGAHLASRMLEQTPGRVFFEDAAARPGHKTHLGFAVSVAEGIDLGPLERLAKAD